MTHTPQNDKTECVAVIGLGMMGGAMAANLIGSGFKVIGYDVDEQSCAKLVSQGGTSLSSPKEVFQVAPIVITSLPSSEALFQVALDLEGSSTNSPQSIFIETSTLALADKIKAFELFQDIGVKLLDCPLSGTGAQAEDRDLVVLASGDEEAFNLCSPVFDAISRDRHYLGEFGNGSRMKFVANLLVANHNAAAAEALVLGMKAGLGPQLIYDVISGSAGSSKMFEIRGPMMVANNYDTVTMKMDLWKKDLDIISTFINELGVKAPLFKASVELYDKGLSQGRHKQDTASICAILEEMAKLNR